MDAAQAAERTDHRLSGVKVAYLHGRPSAHPAHARLAEAVGSEFDFIDARMRWQDRPRRRPYTLASWLVGAALLARRRDYDIFLVDNLHFPPVLMKRLFRRREPRIVAHLGSHTLYFLQSHRFTRVVERLHLWALRNYDALLCEGSMSALIARELLTDEAPPVYETFLGLPTQQARALERVQPDLQSRRIVFIGNGPGDFRLYYKGLDLMIEAVCITAGRDPAITFEVFGEWDDDVISELTKQIPEAIRGRISFRGVSHDIASCLRGACLYLHTARGESFGLAILEAMTAGVVPLVSEWTGARQVVSEVSSELIAPLDAAVIAERIRWYFALDPDQRRRLSDASRSAAAAYTESAAVSHYQATFAQMCTDLGISPRTPAPSHRG